MSDFKVARRGVAPFLRDRDTIGENVNGDPALLPGRRPRRSPSAALAKELRSDATMGSSLGTQGYASAPASSPLSFLPFFSVGFSGGAVVARTSSLSSMAAISSSGIWATRSSCGPSARR